MVLDIDVARRDATAARGRGVLGQRGGAFGDRARPVERLGAEPELLAPLPSLRPSFGRVTVRKVDRLSCVRIGSARYSVPIQLIGKAVEVVAMTGG